MKTPTPQFLINLIGFQLLWPAAVLGAASGYSYLAWWVLAAMLWLPVAAGSEWRRDLRMLATGFTVCLLVEPVWLQLRLIDYVDASSRWLAPGWIWALWGGFAISFFYCLAWLQTRPVLAVLFGGLGGAFSVLMGVKLGAAQAPQGEWKLMLVYGAIWAVIVPLFGSLARWFEKSSNTLGNGIRDHG